MGLFWTAVISGWLEASSTWGMVQIFSWIGNPNGNVTPVQAGDEYIDTVTWWKWYASDATDSNWKEMNYME